MKKMNSKITVITIFCCLAFVSFSNAQSKRENAPQKPPTFAQLLKDMDANDDGKLAKSELKGPLKDDFDTVDTDKDGFISEKEFKKAPKPKRGAPRNRD